MDPVEQLRKAAASLLSKAEDASLAEYGSAIEKATGVLRLSADLDRAQAVCQKLALEERKLRQETDAAARQGRSQRLQQYITLLTPLATIVGLAATLAVQSWQFHRTESDKAAAVLDAQWENAAKIALESDTLPAKIIALHPFLNSPKYGERARIAAMQLLINNTDIAVFEDLFTVAFVPVDWKNLGQLLTFDRTLHNQLKPLSGKSWNWQIYNNDLTRLDAEERTRYRYYAAALSRISTQIGSVLGTQRPADVSLNLAGTFIHHSDWHGINLSGANLQNVTLAGVDLRDANLENITQFSGISLFNIAWWDAKAISPQLREHLERAFPCIPGRPVGFAEERLLTAEECAAIRGR